MKLSDLKEVAMTHKEYDSITNKVVSMLRSLFNVDELVDLAKQSPYLQDRAKLDNAIHSALARIDKQMDPQIKTNVVQRIRKVLGV